MSENDEKSLDLATKWHLELPILVDNVKLIDGVKNKNLQNSPVGTLYLTATHLIFVDCTGKKETWILHMHVSSVSKQSLSTTGCPLVIRCKTFQVVTFIIPKERDCHDIYTSLLKLSKPGFYLSNLCLFPQQNKYSTTTTTKITTAEYSQLFAFHYTPSNDLANESKTIGWDAIDLRSEYLRMGVPNKNWIEYDQTNDYELCDTYPRFLYMPSGVSKTLIKGTSKFRSRGRLPVLSYLHVDQSQSLAAICRCAQPLSGLTARCNEDEDFLQCIITANPNSNCMYVVDNRPMINALANRAKGKGYENESNYQNIKFHFAGIENIHVMRNSLNSLREACEKNLSMSGWLKALKESGWLKHVKDVLDASKFVADAIKSGTSVLVHCSDGWDRTAQTCALASLILDPYYRTIEGFQFNERLLFELHDHAYSCQFGTFIGNCEKDRIDLRLREKTYSLWSEIRSKFNDFINPFYEKEHETCLELRALKPDTSPSVIKFWKELYLRYDFGAQPRESVSDTVSTLKDHIISLKEHANLLENRIGTLCRLLNKEEETVKASISMISSSESMDFSTLQILDDTITSPTSSSVTSPGDNESGFEDSSISRSSSFDCLQVIYTIYLSISLSRPIIFYS
ncbi:DgyrCDS3867 [Dimorphilus gyrociliatus]|uniref:DgyrCDS3867 n=1 Tax=Dimorphilus gyrociliatus TaxID=2664684 RepID=A0A7I8VJT6_9ANNE|nr:DgyrCDS3867 [Dimorphilus gyrociliatus]